MNTKQKTYKPIRPIKLPGFENQVDANEVSDHIDFQDCKATNAEQVYEIIMRLREYGIQHGLGYITFHPRTCDPYYPALMEMLNNTFRMENFYHTGVHEFYTITW